MQISSFIPLLFLSLTEYMRRSNTKNIVAVLKFFVCHKCVSRSPPLAPWTHNLLISSHSRAEPGPCWVIIHNTFICSKQVSRQWSVKLLRGHKTVCICHLKTKQCWDLGPLPGAEDSKGLQLGCKVQAVLALHFNISNNPLQLLLESKTKHHTFNTKTQAPLVDLLKLTSKHLYLK